MEKTTSYKKKGLAWVAFAYIIATALAIIGASFFPEVELLWLILIADLIGTVVIFIFSIIFRNGSFYDAYWSVAPIAIVVYYLMIVPEGINLIRAIACTALVFIWGIRLTYNWARGWTGLDHEDWRYGNLRKQTGVFYPAVNFLGIHLFPTLMVFMGCLGLYSAFSTSNLSFGFIDALGVLIGLMGIYWEATADRQLHRFKQTNPPKGSFLKEGLWAYSRHPNYFGEISFWIGICLLGLGANPDFLWPILGPVAMILMFLFISIPMIDKRMKASRANYEEHIQKASMIVPWFKK